MPPQINLLYNTYQGQDDFKSWTIKYLTCLLRLTSCTIPANGQDGIKSRIIKYLACLLRSTSCTIPAKVRMVLIPGLLNTLHASSDEPLV